MQKFSWELDQEQGCYLKTIYQVQKIVIIKMKSFNNVKTNEWEKKRVKHVLIKYWQPSNYERKNVKLI